MRGLAGFVCMAAALQAAGSEVCTPCHAAIAARYRTTPMARSAGAFSPEAAGAEFATAAGLRYRVDGRELRFAHGEVSGARTLAWFVGSGHVGRSFLFATDGFLFQAPVSYFARQQLWDASPGYETRTAVDLTRAVEPACLQCHASGLVPVAGTQNRFAASPFAEGGVSCQRCHGESAEHVRTGRKTAIVQPAKLAPEERDSVCAQCHLTGAARVARAGAKAKPYRPGAKLSETLAVFVWEGGGGINATSHYDRLNRSACKQASGTKLWCATCHSVHAAAPVSYRERCQSCHEQKPCTETAAARAARDGDCTACHMPKREPRLGDHLAFTDHRIPRRPAAEEPARDRVLQPYWPAGTDARDAALAYAVAAMTEPAVRRMAVEKLEAAAQAAPRDVPVLVQLAQFYERLRRDGDALALYERAVALEPGHLAATVNLGTQRAQQGRVDEAMQLWRAALRSNPAQTGVRLNLAVALARTGRRAEALAEVETALRHDPDSAAARRLRGELR